MEMSISNEDMLAKVDESDIWGFSNEKAEQRRAT